jgi:hypothetical protein
LKTQNPTSTAETNFVLSFSFGNARHVSGSYAAHPSQILDWLHPFINIATIAALVDASERGLSLPASTVEVIAEHREELARRARAKADKRAKRRDGGQAAYGYHGRR